MSPKSIPPPSQRQPAGLPPSANSKYAVIVGLLIAGSVAVVALKMRGGEQPVATGPAPVSTFDAAPVSHSDDFVPPPPASDEPSAHPTPGSTVATPHGTFDACPKSCGGTTTPELEQQLAFRARQSHKCYDSALTQNGDLRGMVTLKVKVGTNGSMCGAAITANDMGSDQVANCVANVFRSTGSLPAPKGGCVEVGVPISFSPGGK